MRGLAWFILVMTGIVAAMAAYVWLGTVQAVGIFAAAVATWIAFGAVLAYYAGVRRHVVAHLGRDWHQLQVVTHQWP